MWWLMPVTPAMQEAEIRRILVQNQPGQKVKEDPISINKLGMVVHFCNSSYVGGHIGGLWSETGPGPKCKTISKDDRDRQKVDR
jgi:hypothetical protein